MKLKVIKIDGASAGSVELGDDIFGLDPRVDILHRVVRWQRNKAQAGTHKVKTRSKQVIPAKRFIGKKAPVAPGMVIGMLLSSGRVACTKGQLRAVMHMIFPRK